MKKIDEIKVDLVNSKWLSFNKIDLENDPLVRALSKALKKDEVVYSIVSGIILLEDKKLVKESNKLAKLQIKQAKSEKPVSEAMQKTMDEVADELANPKRAGKAMMVMTDKRVITVYEDLNKEYKVKAYKRNIEDIMGIDASKDASEPNLYNFVVSFGKVVVRMVTTSEQNIKHFEFALDQTIAMEAEKQIIKEDEKIVDKEAKKIVKTEKVETKKAPAKKSTKPVAKKAPAKKATVKKPTAKKPAAKKPSAKKPAAKKAAKPVAKKTTKPAAKKAPAKKPSKLVAKKTTKPAAKKPVAKKAPAKKAAPKSATKKVDAVVIGDENKSFKKQEKEISKVEAKQAKETKKDAKKAFKPAKAKKQKPAKAAKAPKAKKTKAAKPAKAKKAFKLSFKSIFDLSHVWQLIMGILTAGIIATAAVMFSGNWGTNDWIVPAACQVGFAGIAVILGVITLIPEILNKKFSYAKGMGLVLFVFILVLAILSVAGVGYSIMDAFQYIVVAMSAWLIFDNLFNGIKGFIKPSKKRA